MNEYHYEEVVMDSMQHQSAYTVVDSIDNPGFPTKHLTSLAQHPVDTVWTQDAIGAMYQPRQPYVSTPSTPFVDPSIFRSTSSLLHFTSDDNIQTISSTQLQSLTTPTSTWTSSYQPSTISTSSSWSNTLEVKVDEIAESNSDSDSDDEDMEWIKLDKLKKTIASESDDSAGAQGRVSRTVKTAPTTPKTESRGPGRSSPKTPSPNKRILKKQVQTLLKKKTTPKKVRSSSSASTPAKAMKIAPSITKRAERLVTPLPSIPVFGETPSSPLGSKSNSKGHTVHPTQSTTRASKLLSGVSRVVSEPATPRSRSIVKDPIPSTGLVSPARSLIRKAPASLRVYTPSPTPSTTSETGSGGDGISSKHEDAFIPDEISEGETELMEIVSDEEEEDTYIEIATSRRKFAAKKIHKKVKTEVEEEEGASRVDGRDPERRRDQNQTAAARHRMKKRALDNVYATGFRKLFGLRHNKLPSSHAKILKELREQIMEICPRVAESLGIQA